LRWLPPRYPEYSKRIELRNGLAQLRINRCDQSSH
jgi:hypothetical protein